MDRNTRLILGALRKQAWAPPYLRKMVPAFMLVRPLRVIAAHPESTEEEKSWGLPALAKLIEACNAPLNRVDDRGRILSPEDRSLIKGLIQDICRYGRIAMSEGRHRKAMWDYLATLYWLEQASDANPTLIEMDTPLYAAVALLLEAHERHLDIAAEMDNSARGGAKRLAAAFDRIELFPRGVAVKVAA